MFSLMLTYVKSYTCNLRFFCYFLILARTRSMHYFLTTIHNITSGNTMNVLATAIASVSFLVTKQVLRCQKDD